MLGRTDQDIAHWAEVVASAPAGRVLELACGTGRVAVPLAAAGVPLVGLDVDPGMLAAARAGRGAARWPLLVAADMRRFSLAARFSAVLIPYNSIQLLVDPADALRCLEQSAAHLQPGGVVGLEVTDFQAGERSDEGAGAGAGAGAGVGGGPAAAVPSQPVHTASLRGHAVTLWGSLAHDLPGRVSRYGRRFEGPGWTVEDEVTIRSYGRDEVALLLRRAGLVPDRWWVDGPRARVVARPSC